MFDITISLVGNIIREQFPQWSDLHVFPVKRSGHDNRSFHLGTEMIIRLPSSEAYIPQIDKEFTWLPRLQPHLSLPVTVPLAMGKASADYPSPWLINRYISGESANHDNITCPSKFAMDLARFLQELQSIDATGAPLSGQHNFFRGGDLAIYHNETQKALDALKDELPTDRLSSIWQQAISSEWLQDYVWVHGDIAPGNLLVKDGSLCGVIDFGQLAKGDPACDYAIAWTFLNTESRKVFFENLGADIDTIIRARGWALWKALITYDDANGDIASNARETIEAILNDRAFL